MNEAEKAFELFTGMRADDWIELRIPDLKDVVFLGVAKTVVYEGIIGGEDDLYEHEFKSDPPVFVFGAPGEVLLIYGEGIKLTKRGIVG